MRKLIAATGLVLVGAWGASPAFATNVGTLHGQDGWSAGCCSSSGFSNNVGHPSHSNSDLFYDGDWHGEAVTTADAHSGSQSWHFRSGYDSPGGGTPFSPGLSSNAGRPSSGAAGDTLSLSLWFKAANATGDDSRIALVGGNPGGYDRSSDYLEIVNTVSGITVRTYVGVAGGGWGGGYLPVATGLDGSIWHELTMTASFLDGAANDVWTYQVDGGTAVAGGAYFTTVRDNFGWAYETTNSLKFQPRHPNYDSSFSGFYFDDFAMTVSNSSGVLASYSTGFEVIPEPSSFALLSLGLVGLGGYRTRRRHK